MLANHSVLVSCGNQSCIFKMADLSVTEQCAKIYEEILDFVKLCILFCDMNITLIKALLGISTSSGQKQSCTFTINLIQSLRDDLRSWLVKEGGKIDQNNLKWLDSESAFEKSIRIGIIKNLRHIEPIKLFENAKKVFAVEIKKTLDEKRYNLKVYNVLEATFARQKVDETIEELKHFNTKTFPIYMISDVEKMFAENVSGPTLKNMEEFAERESQAGR